MSWCSKEIVFAKESRRDQRQQGTLFLKKKPEGPNLASTQYTNASNSVS